MSSSESNIFPRASAKAEGHAAPNAPGFSGGARSHSEVRGMPAHLPEPLPPMMPGAPGVRKESIPKPGSVGYVNDEAHKLIVGLTTLRELMAKYGPHDLDAIMGRTKELEEFAAKPTPEFIQQEKWNQAMQKIPYILGKYWGPNKTENSETKVLNLFKEIENDPRFIKIFEPIKELMAGDHEGTSELYETNAMKTYYELYHKSDNYKD